MLGLRFSRLVHAAIASGALVLGACNGGSQDTETDTDTDTSSSSDSSDTHDPTTGEPPPPPPPPADVIPPALVSVTMVDPITLQLSFTEPIANVETVNPKRFRLSFAMGYFANYGGQPQTSLRDPRFYDTQEYCPPPPPGCYYEPLPYYCYYGPYCYYQPSAPILVADVFNHYYDQNSVILSLTEPIRFSLCNWIDNLTNENSQAVLHLHYASGGLSQITDLAGVPMASLGDLWVKDGSDFYYYSGQTTAFANFNPFLPIPCTVF